jgi:hypothetical protein
MGYVVRADVMDVQVPERSVAQRMEALQHANEVRLARAEWKREVKRDPSHNACCCRCTGRRGGLVAVRHDARRRLPAVDPEGRAGQGHDRAAAHGDQPGEDALGLTDRQRAEVHAFVVPYMRRGSISR